VILTFYEERYEHKELNNFFYFTMIMLLKNVVF